MQTGYPYPDPGQSEHFIALLGELHKTLMQALTDADRAVGEGASASERVSQIFYAIGLAANALATGSTTDDPAQQERARATALAIISQGMARPINLVKVDSLSAAGVFTKPLTPDH